MKSRRLFLFAASFFAVLLGMAAQPALAQDPAFYIASDSYYRMNVPEGTIDARVEATVQSSGSSELSAVTLWAMPQATDIAVKHGDKDLAITTAISPETGSPLIVTVTLDKAVKGRLTSDLVMTYKVPSQASAVVTAEPGSIEAKFVSQGAGSFVFIDIPQESDNFVEPGCLLVANQPSEVSSAGLLRFVCGETIGLAISGDADNVLQRCAELSDSCRQRNVVSPFIGFAQAITDPAKQLILQAEIEMAGGPKTLSFKYFRTDRAWAEAQFEAAKAALPMLEGLFGFPYPYDQVLLRESNLIIEVGFAGLAFTDRGEMLVTNTQGLLDDREVTVHELAHQWAGLNLEQPFAWEGLAEWANYSISPQLGIPLRQRAWEATGYTDPLATWGASSFVTSSDYWYGRSAAFWFAFERAVGGRENMTAVLGQLDDKPKARDLDAQWFQDRGEEVSRANLDELFLSWVYLRESASPLLAERRAARDTVQPLRDRAATMLLTGIPRDVKANLDDWVFNRTPDQVAEANRLLDQYASLLGRAAENGGVGAGLGSRWNEMTMPEVRQVLDQMTQALDAIAASTKSLNEGADDPAGREALVRAQESFLEGDYANAKILAAGATSIAYNKDAASKLIEIAKQRDSNFSPNFLQKIGLFFADPSASVTSAEEAYAAGDYEKALKDASSAISAWKGSQEKGLFRLSLVVFGMFGLVIGGWALVRRMDRKKASPLRLDRDSGHILPEAAERTSSWQEWLNQKD